KWHTQSLAAFRSPRGPVGVVDKGQIVFQRPAWRLPPIRASRVVVEVDRHTMATGVDDGLLRASLARGAKGMVIEATGCGNVPPSALPGVRAALEARLPVVLVSRCAEGRVAPAYGYPGGGQVLRQLGVIFGQDLPGPKARIKLMVALGATSDVAEIRTLFEAPPLGA
ncbi:MAG TPA: asparaginase, partial [Vicinamibacteria bacterium]|nr:asparaginase [Vicinamibacteria bacterium]